MLTYLNKFSSVFSLISPPNLHKWLLPAEEAEENNTSFRWHVGFLKYDLVEVENPPKGGFYYRQEGREVKKEGAGLR